jgi:hypothetical protein
MAACMTIPQELMSDPQSKKIAVACHKTELWKKSTFTVTREVDNCAACGKLQKDNIDYSSIMFG